MKQTTTPLEYDFNKSYYENFIAARRKGIVASGKINNTFKKMFMANMTEEGTNIVGKLDCKAYVKATYNGSTPDCLVDTVVENIKDIWNGEWTSEGIDRLFGEGNVLSQAYDAIGGAGNDLKSSADDAVSSFKKTFNL